MPDISIQFHATQDELAGFAKDIASEPAVTSVAIYQSPFKAEKCSEDDFGKLLADPNCWRLAFSLKDINLPASGGLNFLDKNPDCLLLDVGHLTNEGLTQSCLSARTESPESLKAWKSIASRLKKMTRAGVIATNKSTGATSLMKSFRYSEGAKLLEEKGVAIIQFTGGKVPLSFEDVKRKSKGKSSDQK